MNIYKYRKILFSGFVIVFAGLHVFTFAQENDRIDFSVLLQPILPRPVSEKTFPFDFAAIDSLLSLNSNGQQNPRNAFNNFVFYKNLEEAAQRSFLTRKLHNLVIRSRTSFYDEQSIQQREFPFIPFEGKTIRKINIKRLDVFGDNIEVGEDTGESAFLENIANKLHVKTNTSIIERNLLFKEGDLIDPELLADNERLLRSLSHIEDARIYVFEDVFQTEFVDVVVMTRDYWSKGFNIQLVDIDAGVVEFYDRNIAGLGREIQMNLHYNANKEKTFGYEGFFNAANLYGTFIDGNIHYRNAFDDKIFQLSIGRNFYTPNVKYAGGASFTVISRIDEFRYPDTTYFDSPLRYNSQDYWIARSFQLKKRGKDYSRSGIAISARVLSNIFYERPPVADNLFYPFHNKNLWLMGIAWTRQNFYRSRFIYGLGQNEDIPTGSIIDFTGAFEDSQFSYRWYLGVKFASGVVLDKTGFLFSSISMGSFLNTGEFEQTVFSLDNKWFSPLIKTGKFNFRQFAQMRYTIGAYRFEDEFLSLSGRFGIRGLRSTKMEGRQKLVFNLESVIYSPANLLGFRFAYFAFTDFGWIGPETNSVVTADFYGGLGLGLKLRSELMVFPALVIRIAFYPVIPEGARFERIFLESDRIRQPDVFRLQKPDIFRFR